LTLNVHKAVAHHPPKSHYAFQASQEGPDVRGLPRFAGGSRELRIAHYKLHNIRLAISKAETEAALRRCLSCLARPVSGRSKPQNRHAASALGPAGIMFGALPAFM
jgi:hypothetical protein